MGRVPSWALGLDDGRVNKVVNVSYVLFDVYNTTALKIRDTPLQLQPAHMAAPLSGSPSHARTGIKLYGGEAGVVWYESREFRHSATSPRSPSPALLAAQGDCDLCVAYRDRIFEMRSR